MSLVPVLLKPRLWAIKNRWFKSGRNGFKELGAVAFSCFIMWGIYAGTTAGLRDLDRTLQGATVDPTIPLGLLLAALFIMIVIPAGVSAMGAFFFARDLDLTISAPLTARQFLMGKTCDVGISVSWMICTFGLPSLIAVGNFYSCGPLYFVGAPLLCLAFFSIAVLLGMVAALLFAAIAPTNRGKQLCVALIFLVIGVVIAMLRGANPTTGLPAMLASPELVRHLPVATSHSWLPSIHCAHGLTALLRGQTTEAFLVFCEFFTMVALLWGALRVLFLKLYDRGLSRVHTASPFFRIHSRSSQRMARWLLPFTAPPTRAVVTKEYKIFSRDLTHTIQLGMLLGITFVYLYNYRFLTGPAKASQEVTHVWNIFLLISNVALGALVVTSICSRFVYPSVSMEGPAFWIVQSAPISLKELLKAKFKSWLTPVSLIAGVIFISGAMALNADVPLVLASCAAGIILCHGLVALGIGVGAIFSQFEWEHSTQLSMNLGSFIFMLVSMFFVLVNLIPLGLMFGTYILVPDESDASHASTLVLVGGLTITYCMNRLTSWWALSAGARALQPK